MHLKLHVGGCCEIASVSLMKRSIFFLSFRHAPLKQSLRDTHTVASFTGISLLLLPLSRRERPGNELG